MSLVKIHIFGLVQGIFLRRDISQKAKELGAVGYVCNLDDGSVYVEAQAERSKLQEMIKWLKNSPGRSEVKEVKIEWDDDKIGATGFEIRY
ncbi:MAG: acylphosphatase, partial [Candidatus Jacksonbacteria bacterium]